MIFASVLVLNMPTVSCRRQEKNTIVLVIEMKWEFKAVKGFGRITISALMKSTISLGNHPRGCAWAVWSSSNVMLIGFKAQHDIRHPTPTLCLFLCDWGKRGRGIAEQDMSLWITSELFLLGWSHSQRSILFHRDVNQPLWQRMLEPSSGHGLTVSLTVASRGETSDRNGSPHLRWVQSPGGNGVRMSTACLHKYRG